MEGRKMETMERNIKNVLQVERSKENGDER